MQKNKQKLLSLLLTVVMVIGLLPMTAFAADTRIPISTVEATSTIAVPVYGATIKTPSFTVTQGSPAYFLSGSSSASWVKKSGDSWEDVTSGTFTEGTWRYKTQVCIDEPEGTTHVLAAPLNVSVNGASWLNNGTPSVRDTYSYAWVSSPEYTVTEATTYTVTVETDGKGTASASPATSAAGTEITLTASPNTGKQFKEWTGADSLTFVDGTSKTSATAKFTMPASNITVKAIFEDIPATKYTLTVSSGTGGGEYAEGTVVSIEANLPAAGKVFDKWTTSDGGSFADANSTNTTFTMPDKDVTVTATYRLAATVDSIAVNSTSHKTAYKVGEALDVTGLTIEATMSDSSTQTINVTAPMVSGFDSSAVAASQTLSITYDGKTTTYNISITKADGPAAPTGLVGVKPTTAGGSDGKITGTTNLMEYSTDSAFTSPTDCSGTEITGLSAGTYYVRVKETATHEAGTYTTVTVPAGGTATVTSIAVNSTSHKTAYKVGESLDVTGLTIEATMSDSSTQTINVTSGMVTGFDSSAVAASQTLTITYDGKTTTYTVEITAASPITITSVTVSPSSTSVEKGGTQTFTAIVSGTGAYDNTVTWSVYGGVTATTIDYSGILTVDIAETAETLTVTAESNGDSGKKGTATVTIIDAAVIKYTLTVNNGSGSGEYAVGDTINIYAGSRSGYTFTGWTSSDVTITNASNKNASFTMPAKDVTVTANWSYNGSGSSSSGGDGSGSSSSSTNAALSDSKVEFDKNEGDDLKVTLKSGSYSLRSIKNGSYTLREGKDYTISGGTVTIKASYLDSLKEGKHSLTFDMNGGIDPVLTIIVSETTVVTDTTETDTQDEKPTVEVTAKFEDVKSGDWFYDAVNYIYNAGLMVGTSDTTFSPYTNTTRGMIVTILHRLEGSPKADIANGFTDVGADKYYTEAVTWASENKIVSGYGNGIFGPENSITREQMAVILMNYAQYKGYDVSTRADLSKFADGEYISPWAKDAMSWANAEGLMQGSGNQLMPADNAQRCQVAAILQSFLERIAK